MRENSYINVYTCNLEKWRKKKEKWNHQMDYSNHHFELIILFVSWETCLQVRKQQLEPDIEQQTGFK